MANDEKAEVKALAMRKLTMMWLELVLRRNLYVYKLVQSNPMTDFAFLLYIFNPVVFILQPSLIGEADNLEQQSSGKAVSGAWG